MDLPDQLDLRDQFAMHAPEPSRTRVIEFLKDRYPDQTDPPTYRQYEEAVCAMRYARADLMLNAGFVNYIRQST